MDGAALADDRSGITFTADLCVPWDAPEAVVDMNSPDLISLGPFPDKVGLVGRCKEAAMSRIMKSSAARWHSGAKNFPRMMTTNCEEKDLIESL